MMLNKKKIKGKIISLIGLPGSGKTTIAKKIRSILIKNNISNLHLDGDDLRSALINKNYTRKNRVKLSRIYLRLSEMFLKQNDVILLSSVSLYDEIEKIYSKKPHIKVFYIEKKFIDKNILKKKIRQNYIDMVKFNIPKTNIKKILNKTVLKSSNDILNNFR